MTATDVRRLGLTSMTCLVVALGAAGCEKLHKETDTATTPADQGAVSPSGVTAVGDSSAQGPVSGSPGAGEPAGGPPSPAASSAAAPNP